MSKYTTVRLHFMLHIPQHFSFKNNCVNDIVLPYVSRKLTVKAVSIWKLEDFRQTKLN
jgi:hypothetical protein